MKNTNFILVISIILIIIIASGCISEQSPYFTPDEVKKILENNSTVKINATYWSENDVIKNIKEINEQCNKPMLATPMYMTTANVNGETITLWIDDTADKKLLCKTNKSLKIKPNNVDVKLTIQQVYTTPTGDKSTIDVYIFHEGGEELELNKTNLKIKNQMLTVYFNPISIDNFTFRKGDILTLRDINLFLNENKINKICGFSFNSCDGGRIEAIGGDPSAYVIFRSSNGDEIAKATFPETHKLYIEITKNSIEFSTGEVILTPAIFRINEKIINYNIGGESTDPFGHKYTLLNLTFKNNVIISLLANLSDLEKLKMVAKLEVNKTYKISYFADNYKLINIREDNIVN